MSRLKTIEPWIKGSVWSFDCTLVVDGNKAIAKLKQGKSSMCLSRECLTEDEVCCLSLRKVSFDNLLIVKEKLHEQTDNSS